MLCHFEIFNTGAYAAGNFKTLPLMQFFPMIAKLHVDIGYHGGIQAIGVLFFLPIGQVLTILQHFEILTWESMGRS